MPDRSYYTTELKGAEGQPVKNENILATHTFDLLDIDATARDDRVDRMEEVTMREGKADHAVTLPQAVGNH